MEKTALLIFKKDCMGCHACEVACKQELYHKMFPGSMPFCSTR